LPAVLPVVLSVAVPGAVGSVGSAGAAVLSESELPVELLEVASLPVLSAVPSTPGVLGAVVLWPAASAAAACEDAGEDVDDMVCAMATRAGGMASEHTRDAQASPAITLARAPGAPGAGELVHGNDHPIAGVACRLNDTVAVAAL
jgi:hypothetical protein